MSYRLSVDVVGEKELKRAFAKAPQIAKLEFSKAIRTTAASVQGTAKQYAPVDQGILRASIHTEGPHTTSNNVEAIVGTNVNYAKYQEEGTGLYGPRKQKIVPRRGKFLVFKKAGQTIFARSVKGSRPHWYFRRARDEGKEMFAREMREALTRIAQALAS